MQPFENERAEVRPFGHRQFGFTMVELLIVVSVIVILATIAVPNYLSSRVVANESSVISTLKQISTAQMMVRNSRFIDVNNDGVGEYGFLGEMSGSNPLRGTGEYLTPAVLNPSFGYIDASGFGSKHGYVFRLYLPNAAGLGLAETASTIAQIDPGNASGYYTVLSWPRSYGKSGQRTFFMNQQAEIHATVDSSYSGNGGAPIANAGLVGVPSGVIVTNSIATAGEVGVDGNRWKPVN